MTRPITQSRMTLGGVDLKTPKLIEPAKRVTVGTPPSRLTVACVWWGTLYGVEYVEKLRSMVARHLSIPHDFVCLTTNQVPDGVVKMNPPPAGEGWWQKVGLFHPDLFGPSSRVFYLDLDMVITNTLDDIVAATDPFCMIENMGMNKGHAAHNSSAMLWTPSPETHRIYTAFSPDVMKQLHGDQCWIWRVRRDEIHNWEKWQIVSYKYDRIPQYKHSRPETSLRVFHGNPKPHEAMKDPLVRDNWR